MKSRLLLISSLALALAFLLTAFLGIGAWSRFGKSYDPVIAFTAHKARLSGNADVNVPTEQVISLYQYTVALRNELGAVYLSLAAVSLLFGAISIGVFLWAKKNKIEQSGPDNPRPFGTSGMPPANSASRAGDTPEASGGI